MYRVSTEGIDDLLKKLGKAGNGAQGVAASGLYEGAGIMADAVSQSIRGIDTEKFRYANGWQRRASPEEKALLENAPKGVAKFRKNGLEVNTSVGLDKAGYGTLNGKTVPIPQIANAINSGTSFRVKQPFFRKAVSQTKSKAIAVIDNAIEKKVEDIFKD